MLRRLPQAGSAPQPALPAEIPTTMIFIDTHAHLYLEQLRDETPEIVARAAAAGVAAIIDTGLDYATNLLAAANAAAFPNVFATAGFHPHEAKHYDHAKFADHIAELSDSFIAFGEIGLDYFHNFSPQDVQRAAFADALQTLVPLGKPIVFHCRDAHSDMLAIIREAAPGGLPGVMHCFSGDLDFLGSSLALGLHAGVDGPISFPRSEQLRDVIRTAPRDRILLETDCPYLAPQKFRGKRNEPSYIPLIAQAVADARGESLEDVARYTTANAAALFGLPLEDFPTSDAVR